MAPPDGYLLDTNILVALIRGRDLGKYLDVTYALHDAAIPVFISAITVGEMIAPAHKFNWGSSRVSAMNSLLSQFTPLDINDAELLQAYGAIDAACERDGRPMGQNDVWLAATAHVTNTTLLTTDKDFDHLHEIWINRDWIDPSSKLVS